MMPPIHSVISSEPGKLSSFDPFGLSPSGIDMEHVLSLCYLLYLLFGCWSWCRFPFFFFFFLLLLFEKGSIDLVISVDLY